MVAPTKPRAVAVYCAFSIGRRKAFQQAALSVAHALVAAKRPLVFGGGTGGLMGVVSGAVANLGGEVTGIMPSMFVSAGGEKNKSDGEPKSAATVGLLDEKRRGKVETIIFDTLHECKFEMAKRSDAFIGLPGGFGTLDEVIEVTTWNQLNIHNKPVVLVNVCSYYDPIRELIRNGIREGFMLPSAENILVFIDGPADHAEHETFDWGRAAIDAIDAWGNE